MLTTVTLGSAVLGVAEVVRVTTDGATCASTRGAGDSANTKMRLTNWRKRVRRDSNPTDKQESDLLNVPISVSLPEFSNSSTPNGGFAERNTDGANDE